MSINRVIISGNLTRDPETRVTASGSPVLNFSVAVNDRRKNPQTGEWENYPNYVDCVFWGNRGESVARFLSKGTKVLVEGKLRYRSWEQKDTGAKASKIEIYVDEIEFWNRDRDGEGQHGGYAAPVAAAPAAPAASVGAGSAPMQTQAPVSAPAQTTTPPTSDVYDEDIPF